MSNLLVNLNDRNNIVSGFHLACFYTEEENLIPVSLSLLKTGIESNEKCIIIGNDSFIKNFKNKMNDLIFESDDKEEVLSFKNRNELQDGILFLSDTSGIKSDNFILEIEKYIHPEKFKRSRIICQMDWLFDLKNNINKVCEFQSQFQIFLDKHRDICVFIECYNSLNFSGHDMIKLCAFYDGLLFEGKPFPIYFSNFKELALTDTLTGLYNERYIHERINEEIFRAKRYRGSCSLIVIRIINSQRLLNKRLELVFRDFSDILRSNLRKVDIIAFYKKDCFAILMPETSKKRAIMIADRIKKVFEEKSTTVDIYANAELLLKIGVSNFPLDTRSAEELVSLADEALTNAINQGGHSVCSISRVCDLFPPLD